MILEIHADTLSKPVSELEINACHLVEPTVINASIHAPHPSPTPPNCQTIQTICHQFEATVQEFIVYDVGADGNCGPLCIFSISCN
jgi:hypothetical protein